jgi:hypothetical protein
MNRTLRGRSVRRLAAVLGTLSCVLFLMAGGAGAAGAVHATQEVTGDQFTCTNGDVFTIQSGTISLVMHEGQTPSGNFNFTGTITPNHIVATDQNGNPVRIVGADWFGATGSDTHFEMTETDHFQILGANGGPVGTVSETAHITVNANHVQSFDFNFGGCATPPD